MVNGIHDLTGSNGRGNVNKALWNTVYFLAHHHRNALEGIILAAILPDGLFINQNIRRYN